MTDSKKIAGLLRHLVSLNEPRNGGPYQGFAASECVSAMNEAAGEIDRLRAALQNIADFTTRCVHDGGFDREIGPIGCGLGDKCLCIIIHPTARAALSPLPADNGRAE